MNRTLLLTYLDMRRSPLASDEDALRLHQDLCDSAPAFYLLLLADSTSDLSQKREILGNLLQRAAAQTIEISQLIEVLSLLPLTVALSVLDAIRLRKINSRRAHDLVLTFLFSHEQFPTLAATRKQFVSRLIRHALGERTWSAARRFLTQSSEDGELFLRRELLRFASTDELAGVREALCFLAAVPFTPVEPVLLKSQAARQDLELGSGLPRETLLGIRGIYHQQFPLKRVLNLAAPLSTVLHVDGPVTRLYKDAFQALSAQTDPVGSDVLIRENTESAVAQSVSILTQFGQLLSNFLRRPQVGGEPVSASVTAMNAVSDEIDSVPALENFEAHLRELLTQEVRTLPSVIGNIGIVLDLSASMLSSGERAYHPAALALALVRLLQEQVPGIILRNVGAPAFSGTLCPFPQGATDLALALLEVAAHQPELILVFTDGYENQRQGDTAQVIQGLRQLGLTLPVYQVVPLFTLAENLSQRRLEPTIPVVPLTHENGVRELLARALLVHTEEQLSTALQAQLPALIL